METKIKEMIKKLKKAGYSNITITDSKNTITGFLWGNDEMYEGSDFYQLLLTEEGKIYKCYYNDDFALDEIDYTQPENIEEITKEIINTNDIQEEQEQNLLDFIKTTAKIN